MKAAFSTVFIVPIALATIACAASHRTGSHASQSSAHSSRVEVSAATASSSGLVLGGRVRCTATVGRSVDAGRALPLTFMVHNVSAKPARMLLVRGGLWLVVRAADGTVYDTRVPLRNSIGGIFASTTIPPGTSRSVPWRGLLPVPWQGPLRVTPGCGQTALPRLTVAVKAPGPRPDETSAITDVVAASGNLLDHCRPSRSRVSVQGRIDPPTGSAAPMRATCW